MEEISLCLEMISKSRTMSNELEELFKNCFIKRRESCNILDLSYFCEYFFQEEGKRGNKALEKSFFFVMKNLKINIDCNSYVRIFTNLHEVINAKRITHDFLDVLKDSLDVLLRKKEIKRGIHLDIIKNSLRKIQIDEIKEKFQNVLDKYNI
jgi:hypothetical protein